MSEDFFQGYKGAALETLKKYKGNCRSAWGNFTGTVLPRAENDDHEKISWNP